MINSILAAQSDFSIGESILTIETLVKDAKAAGAKTVALTDTMSITGMINFTALCKKAEIKPIIGCRLRLVDDHTWRKPLKVKSKLPPEYFLTYYVLSEKGMVALFKLLTLANDEDHFYFTPKLSFSDLYYALTGLGVEDVAIASGSAHSAILHPDARNILSTVAGLLDPANVFLTLTPIDIPYYDSVNAIAIELAQEFSYQTLTARPAYYPVGASDAAEIMTAISKNEKMSSPWHASPFFTDAHVISQVEFDGHVKKSIRNLIERRGLKFAGLYFKNGLQATETLADMATYEWKKQKPSLPVMAPDEFKALVELCKLGWQQRFTTPVFDHQPSPLELKTIYRERLKYELDTLKTLGFSGYFLLVHDVVSFAKSSGILVGPGRGSVGGSLVAYLCGITDCDPIRFGLLFERFINPSRLDLPDADLDFMSARRNEVVDYLVGKYGKARVAGISNFGTLGPSSAIRDVCRVLEIPDFEYRCSKLVPKKHGNSATLAESAEQVAEIEQFATKRPELWEPILKLEGVIRNMAKHAAGVVVAGCDLDERAVVYGGKDETIGVINWDKRIVEDQGLIKMDILGLSTLDIIDLTLKYIRERHSSKINLLRIKLDDPKVLDNFATGQTAGIFQFESGGMRRLLKELGHDGTITFEDITAATALYRPGPMESGMMESFYLRKQGLEAIEYEHPLMEPILEPTFGTMVYQEQVMQISVAIAGYSGADADILRKIMGKKLPEAMEKERDKFVSGCIATVGATKEWATALFDKIAEFAGYGFNKSHSVEYTLISYQAMWLKTYYPVEYLAAALSLMDEDKMPGILKEAERLGIVIDMPDVNHSTGRFEILTDTRIIIPFIKVKSIGDKTVVAILTARAAGRFTSKADFDTRARGRNCNIRHIANLDAIGAFASIEPGQLIAKHPDRIMAQRELIPGLISMTVPINRDMNIDKATKGQVALNMRDYRTNHGPNGDGDGWPVKVTMGKNAQMMVISDAPTSSEERDGMSFGMSFTATQEALSQAGLARADGYWTALIKRPKSGKQITPDEITRYAPYLQREIDLLRPPIIVLLGSTVVRQFLPDFKGKASEAAGTVIYSKELDANIVTGFSPGEVYFSPEKQDDLNKVFVKAAELMK